MQTIKEIQENIANTTITALFYITTPLVALSLLRIIESGWLSVMWLHVGAYFFLSIIFYFRQQVNYHTKISFVLLVFILIGIGLMLDNQQIASGSPFFIIATMWLMIHSNRRMTLLLIAFFALTEFSYILWLNQLSIHNILAVIGYLLLGYIVIDMMGYLKNSLIMLLEQSRQQANQIQQIIDATKVGTWEWNVQTGETIFNERWAQVIGYTLAEVSPVSIQTWKDLTHPDDLKAAENSLNEYFEGHTDFYETDFRMKHKEGYWVWLNDRGQVTQWNKDGSPLWMSGTHADISERKNFEQKIARAHLLIEQSLNEIYLFDKESFYFVDANQAARKNIGYSMVELSSLTPFMIKPEISKTEFIKLVGPLLNGTQQELIFETTHQRKDASHYPVEVHLQLLEDESPVFISIIRDITERVERAIQLQESQTKYQRLVDDIGDKFVIFSHKGLTGELTYVSNVDKDMFGILPEDAIGKSWAELINWLPESRDLGHTRAVQQLEGQLDFAQIELSFIHPDGSQRTIQASTHPVRDRSGNCIAIEGIAEDITEKKLAQEQIRLSASVFSNSQEGILITDRDNRIVDVNSAGLELTGYTREEVIGQSPSLFSSGTQTSEFYAQMWQSLTDTAHWQGEILNRKKSGEIYSERLSIDSVSDEKGQLQHYVAVFYDITHLKEHEAQLKHIAYNDALTGLPNRLLLPDRMNQARSKVKRNKKLFAVCYLDLDGFKLVNDTYGHKAGDRVLVEVAKRLQNAMRADDTVARIGGDEFVLLMIIDTTNELKQILERVLVSISNAYLLPDDAEAGAIDSISASIGLTLYPHDDSDTDMLLRHADQAMYSAKQRGKNSYSFFDANEEEKVSAEQGIQKEVEIALEQNQFELFYQPKVNMHTGEIIGAEALIRWMHPEKGILPPGAFLPSIKHTPLIIEVGIWVLHQTMLQIRLWQSQGVNLKVSVNIDAMHLQQENFIPSLKKLLNEFDDITASSLELEILETSALHDIDSVSKVIKECCQLGIQFSLDDFGTGSSSLTYLKHLSAQVLKIDQSFIRNLLESSDDMAIVEGILGLAHAFHRTPIAEGVETIAIGTLLLNLGCQLAQGYAIARPMPAQELPQWIDNFQIPRQWQESNNALNSDLNYSITQMYINHHHIVSRVCHAIEQRATFLIPEHFQNHNSCEIGKWLATEGKERYGQYAEYKHIVEKHIKIHELIKKVTKFLKTKDDNGSLQQNSIEINKLSNDILDCLNRLRNIV